MRIVELRPKLVDGVRELQTEALLRWRASPEYPGDNAWLRALAICDGAIAKAHVDLPSGILTVEWMDCAVVRECARARRAVRHLLVPS